MKKKSPRGFMTLLLTLVSIVAMSGFVSCGGIGSLIDEAIFVLDSCNPTLESSLTNCQTAVNKADEAQATDSTNLQAAMVESSGYLGLARLDFLTLAADLAELADSAGDDYARFRNFLNTYEDSLNDDQGLTGLEINLSSLQSSKDAFGDLLGDIDVDDEGVASSATAQQAAFQLGVIQALDAFIRPIKLSSGGVANVAANITDAATAQVLADFIDGDNNLIRGGTDEEEGSDLLRPVRENYCRCSLQNPLGGTAGFNITCLRDLMRCELYNGNSIEQDYDSDGTIELADCSALLTPDGLEACGGSNTTE